MKKLWFRAKRYGLGWYPCSWEGWSVLGLYVLFILSEVLSLDTTLPAQRVLPWFLLRVALFTILFIWIAYRTGEPLRWRWGEPKE